MTRIVTAHHRYKRPPRKRAKAAAVSGVSLLLAAHASPAIASTWWILGAANGRCHFGNGTDVPANPQALYDAIRERGVLASIETRRDQNGEPTMVIIHVTMLGDQGDALFFPKQEYCESVREQMRKRGTLPGVDELK